MTTAQVVFAVALGSIAILISVFALYVLSSTVWGDRWIRQPAGSRPSKPGQPARGSDR
jgi:hypothetical protein